MSLSRPSPVLALFALEMLAWARPAEADCKSPGTRCTESERIREQTVLEGNQQRREWNERRGQGSATPSGRPAPTNEDGPACMPADLVPGHCNVLRSTAEQRWSLPDKGAKLVSEMLRPGPPPRCFTPTTPVRERVGAWSAACRLTAAQEASLRGEQPKGAGATSKTPSRHVDEPPPSPEEKDIARFMASFHAHRARSKADRAELEAMKIDLAAERQRCVWGDYAACQAWQSLAPDDGDALWAYTRYCEIAPVFDVCAHLAKKVERVDAGLLRRALEAECQRSRPSACASVAAHHLAPDGSPKLGTKDEADPTFGRALARETCEAGEGAACAALVGAITEGRGGEARASDAEREVLRAACAKGLVKKGDKADEKSCSLYGGRP